MYYGNGQQISSPSLFRAGGNGQSLARASSMLNMDRNHRIEIDPSQQQSQPLKIDDNGHQVTGPRVGSGVVGRVKPGVPTLAREEQSVHTIKMGSSLLILTFALPSPPTVIDDAQWSIIRLQYVPAGGPYKGINVLKIT